MSKPTQKKSHSQMMNEWAAQRSLINQMRSRIVHPPHDAPWYGQLWGYLWRVSLVVGVTALVGYVSIKSRLRTSGFQAHLAEEVSQRYNATQVTCGATSASIWTNECSIKALGADGAEGSFFNRLDAYNIQFDLGNQFLRTDWHLDRLLINELNLSLRSGSYNPPQKATPDGSPASTIDRLGGAKTSSAQRPTQALLKTAGFGFKPDFRELTIGAYDVKQLNLKWGYTKTTAGKLDNANSTLEPNRNGGWTFTATDGELTQNWLTGLKVKKLEATVEDKLLFKEAKFTRAGGEVFELTGAMSLGELPEFDCNLRAHAVDLKSFAPPSFSNYFDASADLEGTLTGTINRAKGIQIKLHAKLIPSAKDLPSKSSGTGLEPPIPGVAWLKNIPLFRSLYVVSGAAGLAQPRATSGSFDLETSEGEMRITNLNLDCDGIRVQGALTGLETVKAAKLMDGLEGLPTRSYTLQSNLKIGVRTEYAAAMPANIQKQYFTEERDGMRWMSLNLAEESGPKLTQSITDTFSRLQKESLIEK